MNDGITNGYLSVVVVAEGFRRQAGRGADGSSDRQHWGRKSVQVVKKHRAIGLGRTGHHQLLNVDGGQERSQREL